MFITKFIYTKTQQLPPLFSYFYFITKIQATTHIYANISLSNIQGRLLIIEHTPLSNRIFRVDCSLAVTYNCFLKLKTAWLHIISPLYLVKFKLHIEDVICFYIF